MKFYHLVGVGTFLQNPDSTDPTKLRPWQTKPRLDCPDKTPTPLTRKSSWTATQSLLWLRSLDLTISAVAVNDQLLLPKSPS